MIELNNAFLFPDPEPPIVNILPILIMFFYSCFVTSSKLFFSCVIVILLNLISSFSLTRSLHVPHACIFIKSFDYILLSSCELKAILLISSVETLCLSLLKLCSVSNISLLFLMNSLFLIL